MDMKLTPDVWALYSIPVATILLLWASTQAYRVLVARKTGKPASAAPRVARKETHGFKMATSLLDTHGGFIASWQDTVAHTQLPAQGQVPPVVTSPPAALPAARPETGSQLDGWLNMMFVVLLTYIATNVVYYQTSFGMLFPDNGEFILGVIRHSPYLMRDFVVLGLFYMVFTLAYQYAYMHRLLPRRLAVALQTVAEATMFFGCVAYARSREDWPITQRFAWLMEVTVLTMKMHSYIITNRHLQTEVDLGGPGTGSVVFGIQSSVTPSNTEGSTATTASSTPSSSSEPAVEQRQAVQASPEPASPVTLTSPPSRAGARSGGVRRRRGDSPSAAQARKRKAESESTAAANGTAEPQPVAEAHEAPAAPMEPLSSPARSLSIFQRAWMSLGRAAAAIGQDVHKDVDTTEFDRAAAEGRVSGASIGLAMTPQEMDTTPTGAVCGDRGAAATALRRHGKAMTRLLGRVWWGVDQEGRVVTTQSVAYPANVSLKDFLLYSFSPTLCYDPNYPRTQSIRIGYILEKTFLASGLMTVGIYVMSHYVLPVVHEINEMSAVDAVVRLLGPMTALMLMCFFIVFECVLNAFAELTRFGDRKTYEAWWNSSTFLEFSRRWNVPVHTFLLRHVYLDTMRRLGFSADVALYFTFIVSIVVHEIVLWGVLGVTTPYLALFSFLQFPLASIMRYTLFKGKRLGNLVFWFGITWGVTLVFALYSREFCAAHPDHC